MRAPGYSSCEFKLKFELKSAKKKLFTQMMHYPISGDDCLNKGLANSLLHIHTGTWCFDKNVPIQTREHYAIHTFTRITIFNMHKIHIVIDVQQNCQLNILHHVCVFAT